MKRTELKELIKECLLDEGLFGDPAKNIRKEAYKIADASWADDPEVSDEVKRHVDWMIDRWKAGKITDEKTEKKVSSKVMLDKLNTAIKNWKYSV